MTIPWTCRLEDVEAAYLFGFLVGLPIGLWVGYRWSGWKVIVMRKLSGWSQSEEGE